MLRTLGDIRAVCMFSMNPHSLTFQRDNNQRSYVEVVVMSSFGHVIQSAIFVMIHPVHVIFVDPLER